MGKDTAIGWCDHTHNLAWGCVKATAGCDFCYAETWARRYGFDVWGPDKPRRTFGEKHWNEPRRWDRLWAQRDRMGRVFTSSMTDNFLNDPVIDAERAKLWPLIAETPHLEWLVLTKHPERFKSTLPDPLPANVRLGVTVESWEQMWRVPLLLATGAPNFLSIEPMIGPLHFLGQFIDVIDWCIVGGESGHGARELDLDWVRGVRDLCARNRVPFFLKQLGGAVDKRDGAAAVLDGATHTEFPAQLVAA